ncbi:MAG: autotransporter outer membrane beta-barrel domain-containing protein, partial [Pseudomonadota bacterium]
QNATVPFINIGRGASVIAQVETNTVTPTVDVANSSSPFALISQAITDQSGSLKLINNAGSITAVNTEMTPSAGTVVVSIQRAIDLTASTSGGTTLNNSGVILGDVLLSSAGNNNIVNVGNTGALGTANATTVVNTPSNYAIVGASLISRPTTGVPTAAPTLLDFGSGTGHQLNVGGFGYLNADIRSGVGALDVTVQNNGLLFVANTATSLQARNFTVETNGVLGLSIAQANLNSLTPVVQANNATLTGANLALQFGTFISSGFTAASVANPTVQTVTLIRAPTIVDNSLADQNAKLGQNTPFLFETPAESGIQPLSLGSSGGQQTLLLNLRPRSVNALNANGTPGLNLQGDAKNQFPFIAAALATDNDLGSAVATSMTVYNTPGVASSGINIAASQQQAQQVFGQFAPDVSGGTRDIAILITDQATGPVAARQRLLRQYGKVPGEMTLWGEEFTGQITSKGRVGGAGTVSSFKDHGFGFAVGVDGGGPRNGWYGGAFTFYTGDVQQQLPRTSKTNTQWFMLTGYTHWQGRKVFFDTQLSAGYGQFSTERPLTLGGGTRIAASKHAGAMGAIGAKGGLMLKYFGIDMDPYLALDGMTMREDGYTERGGGTGMNLQVDSFFATSLRTAVGLDLKKVLPIWGFELTPGGRVGYRYELLQQPTKVKAGFESTGGLATAGNVLTFVGPDPDKGSALLGFSLGAGTDTWHVGVNYDWVRGNNGSTTQVGTISVLGRI